ncbi:glycosyltransferase family 4 protein [Pseudoblastomonas halimionae]|uniref:Glycosyltransferase n=1 Tax=Alteriqipengyuania halimionae TaxID=1926630 RepID=A0A6I4U2U7_9SPHN|nr:glycosyltransferase family 4 protein [Alteriqipengyuania halimionae]MXP10399.1 glycosyltransferase [Alteriqipengyuania halimionae]
MIDVVHLLDDFAFGGVTRALTVFDHPDLTEHARSRTVAIGKDRLAESFDADLLVTHVPPCWSRLGFLLSLRLRNRDARLVHVEHSYTEGFVREGVPSPGRFTALLRLAYSLYDEIVCVSHAQRDWLAGDIGIPEAKLRVIHPWCGREDLFSLRSISSDYERPLSLVAYGRFAKEKNFVQLIEAVRMFPPAEIELQLIGDGPEMAAMREAAAGAPNIVFRGRIDDPTQFLGDCDAVVVPSRYEAFGLVATEARMAARPILVADVDGLPEQVGEGGLVRPMRTPDEIATAIGDVRTSPFGEMGLSGRRAVVGQAREILAGWKDVFVAAGSRTADEKIIPFVRKAA